MAAAASSVGSDGSASRRAPPPPPRSAIDWCRERATDARASAAHVHHRRACWPVTLFPPLPHPAFESPVLRGRLLLRPPPLAQAACLRLDDHHRVRLARLGRGSRRLAVVPRAAGGTRGDEISGAPQSASSAEGPGSTLASIT
jgi:hypothetical protein